MTWQQMVCPLLRRVSASSAAPFMWPCPGALQQLTCGTVIPVLCCIASQVMWETSVIMLIPWQLQLSAAAALPMTQHAWLDTRHMYGAGAEHAIYAGGRQHKHRAIASHVQNALHCTTLSRELQHECCTCSHELGPLPVVRPAGHGLTHSPTQPTARLQAST